MGTRATQFIWLTAGFVAFSILSILVVPLWIGHKIEAVRQMIDQTDLSAIHQLQSIRTSYLLQFSDQLRAKTFGDSEAAARFYQDRADVASGLEQLHAVSASMTPHITEMEARFEKSLGAWMAESDLHQSTRVQTWLNPEHQLKDDALIKAVNDDLSELERLLGSNIENDTSTERTLARVLTNTVFLLSALGFIAFIGVMLLAFCLIKALRQAELLRREAEDATSARDEILRIVSHDLRNPVNIVSIAGDQLADTTINEQERRKFVEVVQRATKRMNNLIQTLLDVGKTQSGTPFVLNVAPNDVASILAEACEFAQVEARSKSIKIVCENRAGAAVVNIDREKVLQVLMNLIGNAIKFTPSKGRVSISSSMVDGSCKFSLRDTGPGISPDEQSKIFDAYWQSRKTAHLGTGLGLAIAKRIVEEHRGRIWVESELGHGSTFAFMLPMELAKAS